VIYLKDIGLNLVRFQFIGPVFRLLCACVVDASSATFVAMAVTPRLLTATVINILLRSELAQVRWRYDTKCYFNVRSKADISQLNLSHGTKNKTIKTEKELKSKKTDMLRSVGKQSRESVE